MKNKPPKALLLFSGGLDSLLAGEILRRNNVQVTCLTFTTPFFSAEKSVSAARLYNFPLIIAPLPEKAYINILINPAWLRETHESLHRLSRFNVKGGRSDDGRKRI